jgi:hypothetical protein
LKRIGLAEADQKICHLLQLDMGLNEEQSLAHVEKNPGVQ